MGQTNRTGTVSQQRIARRLDALALEQLRATAAALIEENDRLRASLERAEARADNAEEAAYSWRDDALRFQLELCEREGGAPGLTIDGGLVIVPAVQS